MSEYQVDHWDDSGMTNQVDQIWEVFGMEEEHQEKWLSESASCSHRAEQLLARYSTHY